MIAFMAKPQQPDSSHTYQLSWKMHKTRCLITAFTILSSILIGIQCTNSESPVVYSMYRGGRSRPLHVKSLALWLRGELGSALVPGCVQMIEGYDKENAHPYGRKRPRGRLVARAGIFKEPMGARHRVGIGLLYRPARLHRLAEFIPWNRCLGSINV
jgi:hypothetical protein